MISSEDILEATNSVKVLVLMEAVPLTDRFEQIMFTPEQARQVRDAVFKILCPGADDQLYTVFDILTNDEVTATFTNVKDSYDANYLKEEQKKLEEAE